MVIPPLLAAGWIIGSTISPAQTTGLPTQAGADAPDVSDIVEDLSLKRLDPPLPVLFVDTSPSSRQSARRWQIMLLEARAFWRNLLGSAPDGGLLLVDSSTWVALRPDRWYGFPGTSVWTRGEGRLTLLAVEEITEFGEMADWLFRLSPVAYRGLLLAHRLASPEGGARYAQAWTWLLLGEGIAEGLRIGVDAWWQRRLVGAAAVWMLFDAQRGRELAPGAAEALEAWGWFLQHYLNRKAVSLSTAAESPPAGEQDEILELDARLVAMGKALWQEYGVDVFARMRRAWPLEAEFENHQEALDALWQQMPEMASWESTLLEPRREPAAGYPRR